MGYLVENPEVVLGLAGEHLYMTVVALVIATAVALPLSMILVRRERLSAWVLGILGVFYTIPSIALLILLLPVFGLNQTSVIAALVIYAQIILVRNMVAGLKGVPAVMLEAARGLGMNSWQRWWRVQLRLALPVILAGVRVAAIVAVAIATIGAKFGAGGLGRLLFDGIAQNRYDKIVAGSIAVALLAFLLNWLLMAVENYFDVEKRVARSG
jgi:osmoprotectant transport system permease protein